MTPNSQTDLVPIGPPADQVRDELSRILESPAFKSTPRRKKLLGYLVEELLAGNGKGLKGYTIATIVFGRDESFDPQTDPVVRLEARRLRHDLSSYYVSAGRDNPLRITIPKGQYVPVIEWAHKPLFAEASYDRAQPVQSASNLERGKPRTRISWRLAAAGTLGLVAVLGVVLAAWDLNEEKDSAAARGPALAVLPFSTTGLAPQHSNIGRGIADAVLAGLSRFPDVRLYLAGPEAQASEDPVQIGNRLGLTYVLQGSAQSVPGSENLRITARLLEVSSRRILWIGNYERNFSGAFLLAAQDEIAASVASTIGQPYGIIRTEESRALAEAPSPSLTSYECVLQAYSYRRSLSREAYEPALACLQRAVEQDPRYAEAWAMLGWLQMDAGRFGWTTEGDTQAAFERGLATALYANAIDRENISSLKALGSIYHYLGRFEESERVQREALRLNPNDPDTIAQLGWRLAIRGRFVEGIPLLRRAIERSVDPPGWYYHLLAVDQYLRGDYAEMLQSATAATADGSGLSWSLVAIAAGALEDAALAERALQTMAKLSPRMANDPSEVYRRAKATEEVVNALVEGLVRAGWVKSASANPSSPQRAE